jgi:DHA1 family bicyclomycin/chloramphenicol resistance-like MFS transporter
MSACMVGLGRPARRRPLSDRFGRCPLLVGVSAFAVLSLVCAVAPGIEVLLIVASCRDSPDPLAS